MKLTGRAVTVGIASAVALMLAGASARSAEPLRVGDRIRLSSPTLDPPVVGRIVRADSSRLTILTSEPRGDQPATVRSIDRASLTRIERSEGHDSNVVTGILLGGTVGLTAGIMIVDNSDPDPYSWAGLTIPANTCVIGMLLGGIVGGRVRRERWSVWATDARFGLRDPEDGPVQFTIRMSF